MALKSPEKKTSSPEKSLSYNAKHNVSIEESIHFDNLVVLCYKKVSTFFIMGEQKILKIHMQFD